MYNYLEEMKNDVIEAIKEKYEGALIDLEEGTLDFEDFEEQLRDDLWIDDSVTGNASGSYYCNSYKSKMAVMDNVDLCKEALREFCVEAETVGEKFLNEEWEWLDVTIRCYLLGQAISEALEEMGL